MTDLYERIEWTPPLFGWHYRMSWTAEKLMSRIRWYGDLADQEMLPEFVIHCAMEPKVRVMWTISIGIPRTGIVIHRSHPELARTIKWLEEDVQNILEHSKRLGAL